MGNRPGGACSCSTQRCAEDLGLASSEDRAFRDPDCDPAGTVFNETLEGLKFLDQEALRFAGTSNLPAVRWLLAMGADVKVHDSKGTTMLHAACRIGSFAIVRELLRQSVPVDAADSAGWTPLHVAAVMGRRPLAMLLLQHGANAAAKNKRGATPAAVCTDPATREAFKASSHGALESLPSTDSKGGIRGDASDRTTCCVPFFVPRQPLFLDCAHSAELVVLCSELLDRSVGHGLAFCVAVGVVKDRPTDLSHFLLEQRTNPKRLGEFLGEELSMSETLRLAFMDSMDLFNTGVVSALCRAFRHIRAPLNFGKIDRLTTAVAHMWWRAHDVLDDIVADDDGLLGSQVPPVRSGEFSGMGLRRHLRSVEGLQRLMFSTVMLCWALHSSPVTFPLPAKLSKDHLSNRGWLGINRGIEVDGSNVPPFVLEAIFQAVSEQMSTNLLPSFNNIVSPRSMKTVEPCIQGWACIPTGGLERYEPAPAPGTGLPCTPHLAQCILSEASPTPALTPRTPGTELSPMMSSADMDPGAEVVWLSLRFSLILFLATSPSDVAPYAFLRLSDAVLRDVDRHSRQLVLAGRPRRPLLSCSKDKAKTEGAATDIWESPFGDIARHPLELCFLLRDGRFQSFATLWFELRFNTDEDLELWLREFGSACRDVPPALAKRDASSSERERGVDLDAVCHPRFPSPVSPAAKPRTPPHDTTPEPPLPPGIPRTPPHDTTPELPLPPGIPRTKSASTLSTTCIPRGGAKGDAPPAQDGTEALALTRLS